MLTFFVEIVNKLTKMSNAMTYFIPNMLWLALELEYLELYAVDHYKLKHILYIFLNNVLQMQIHQLKKYNYY